jgi:hypothetical protein
MGVHQPQASEPLAALAVEQGIEQAHEELQDLGPCVQHHEREIGDHGEQGEADQHLHGRLLSAGCGRNELADEITVILQTDQGLADDERRDLNEALDEAVHLVARIETVTS